MDVMRQYQSDQRSDNQSGNDPETNSRPASKASSCSADNHLAMVHVDEYSLTASHEYWTIAVIIGTIGLTKVAPTTTC